MNFSIGLDWLQFGVANIWGSIAQEFRWEQFPGNKFYQFSYRPFPGAYVWCHVRDGLPELQPESTVELRGEFFRSNGDGSWFLRRCYEADRKISLQRFDVALDVFSAIGEVELLSSRAGATVYHDGQGRFTGWKIGKGDRVLRLYDKGLETKQGGDWWRLEMVYRGGWAKQFQAEESELIQAGINGMSDRSFANFSHPLLDEIIEGLSLGAPTGPSRSRNPKFENRVRFVVSRMRSLLRSFHVQYSKENGEVVLSDRQLWDLLGDAVCRDA